MKTKKILILIPIYNEAGVIVSLLKEIKGLGYKNILIVDDGSTDITDILLKKQRVMYIRHIINRGKGAAMRTGMEANKKLDYDIIVTLDGDGQHAPKDISKLVKAITKGSDIALGCRPYKLSNMPLIRIIFNQFANKIIYLFYGISVHDSQSGFRAYSKKALDLISTQSDGYEFDTEILREIKKHRLSYKEVAISAQYTKYSLNKLKKQNVFNGAKMLFRMIISLS